MTYPSPLDRARRAVHDPDPTIRQEAALRLGTLADASMAAELVSLLVSEDDFFVRETLTWAVVAQAEAALPHLLAALDRPDASRVQVLHALSKIRDQDAVPHILPLADDPDPAVAAKAWWALGRTGTPQVVPTLVDRLGDEDEARRRELTAALEQLGAPAVPALAERLLDRSTLPEVRRHAAEALAAIGDPGARGALDALVTAVEEDDKEVSVVAVSALGLLDLAEVDGVLERLRESQDRWLAITADWLLTDRAERRAERRPRQR
ncbi:HEAT repeat domain-containing protein [Ornithinimicrobium sp. LYQ103]|uniref:HEAT repeat domain-containing protein n=1 Tax=Ornithinimicrobium sp. LYQ103 TaxID=3378796 RepID=UPI003852DB19